MSYDDFSLIRLVTTLMVYVMSSDGDELKPEERSRLMTFLGKFASTHDINERDMQVFVKHGMKTAASTPFLSYLNSLDLTSLRNGQRLAIYANVYDAMLIDAVRSEGEMMQMEQLRRKLHIDAHDARPLHFALSIKDDPNVLTNLLHPLNEIRGRDDVEEAAAEQPADEDKPDPDQSSS